MHDPRQIDLLNRLAVADASTWPLLLHKQRDVIDQAFIDCMGARYRDVFMRAITLRLPTTKTSDLVDTAVRYCFIADMAAREVGRTSSCRLELASRFATCTPPVPSMVLALSRSVLLEDKRNVEARLLCGRASMLVGDYFSALTQYEEITHLAPSNAEAWSYVGLLYWSVHQAAKAMPALKRGAELGYPQAREWLKAIDNPAQITVPTDIMLAASDPRAAADPEGARGTELQRGGQVEEAEKMFKEGLRLHPGSPLSSRGMADIYFKRGDLYKAVDAYSLASHCAPDDAEPLRYMALSCERVFDSSGSQAHLERAIEALHRVLSIKPDYPQARADLERIMNKKIGSPR